MATNRNKNTGNISAPQGANKNKGITSAIDQAGYRREFNERVFSDTGYIQSSIKDLQEQVSELEKVLSKSKELTKSEQTRYKNAVSNMKRLESQLQQMYKSQDVSSNELFDTLNDSIKARQKAVDDLYKHYMNKEKELDKAGKEQIDKKVDYFAAKTRELKGVTEEIHEASEKFNDSQKSFSDGIDETLGKINKAFGEASKIFNLQSIASNEFLEKANERYDIINQLNQSLGYGTEQATAAYNSATNTFAQLNEKVDNLYNISEMRQYLKDSQNYGLLNQEVLEKNLNATLTAQKYMGATSETLTSLYRYSRLTNNNEAVDKYNKTMIALQKEGIGVNKDMLNNMIQSNIEASDVLTAAGLSGETLDQFNQERTVLNAQIQDKYGQEYAEQINSLVDESIKKLATTEGEAQLAQMGIDPSSFKAEVSQGDAQGLYDMVIKGITSRANSWNSSDWSANLKFFNQLGLNTGDINAARKINGDGGIDSLGPVTEEVQKIVDNMSSSDAEQYVKENTAMSDITKGVNGIETWLQKNFGNSKWFSFENLGTAAFAAYLASGAASFIKTGGSAIIKGINYVMGGKLAEKLGSVFGGKLSGVANKFFGNSSTIGKSASNMTATGSGGKGLSMLATGTVIVGLAATTISALGSYFTGKREEAYANQYDENLENLKGTAYEGNNSVASADSVTSSTKSMTALGSMWSNFTNGLGYFFEGLGTSDKITRNQSLTKWMYQSDTFPNRDAVMSWAILLDTLDSLKSLNNLGFNFSSEELQSYASNMAKEGKDNIIWGYIDSFLKAGWRPYKDDGGGRISSYEDFYNSYQSKNNEDTEGYHKAGLERVPKDNYRALLHKNEMVLNERDANEYRAILKDKEKNKNVPGIITGNGFGTGGVIGGVEVGNYNENYVTNHSGLDLYFNQKGTPVGSAIGGSVITSKDITTKPNGYTGRNSEGYYSYGRYVEVLGDDGQKYIYAHLNERVAKVGQRVEPGTLLGYSGNTGNSTGPHLHFEIRGLGKGSAKHAKYYTHFVRDVNGVPSGEGADTNISNTIGENTDTHIKLATPTTTSRRAIPGIGGSGIDESNTPKSNGVDRIVNSVDGVSAKIIKYLDEIRQEQESQRSLIRAFSNSQNMLDMRN